MEINSKKIQAFIQAVDAMKEAAIGCDDAFELLDQYVELVLAGKPAKDLLPQVAEHLECCKACREEYEILKNAIASMNPE